MVTYNWWCDTMMDCFLENVTYKGCRVKLDYEINPDGLTGLCGDQTRSGSFGQ